MVHFEAIDLKGEDLLYSSGNNTAVIEGPVPAGCVLVMVVYSLTHQLTGYSC